MTDLTTLLQSLPPQQRRVVAGKVEGRGVVGGMGGGGVVKGSVAIEVTSSLRFT